MKISILFNVSFFCFLALLSCFYPIKIWGAEEIVSGERDIIKKIEEIPIKLGGLSLAEKKLKESIQKEIPNISQDRSIEALFLGPNAENFTLVENLITEAFRDHAYWRKNFSPLDPSHISEDMQSSLSFLKTQHILQKNFRYLLAKLKNSVPFFSMRYQGHMNWENTIPSIVGYFAGMLYNSNNVTFEASPVTSALELIAIQDLCTMIGYIADKQVVNPQKVLPWGHITCDGTIANIEALWASRNLKFYALAIQRALNKIPALAEAKDVTVMLLSGEEERLISINDPWKLLNIKSKEILELPKKIHQILGGEHNISLKKLFKYLSKYSLQNIGLKKIYDRMGDKRISNPIVIASGTKHYSISKAVSLMGLGLKSLVHITVDQDARMDIEKLEYTLEKSLINHTPVLTVVAIMGTTEESAVDPLKKIIDLRKKFRKKGLDFNIHADAAWGGYHTSLLRGDVPLKIMGRPAPVFSLNKHVTEQFEHLKLADSITIDPHKSGYVPYAAGTICYRNAEMKNMITFDAPYISSIKEKEPTIGIYGVEGSRPGAAATSVFLSHQVIPLDKRGYGKIIGQCLFNCKMLYARLLDMGKEDDFIIIPLSRLPAEQRNKSEENIQRELKFIKERISRVTNENIIEDQKAMKLLKKIGPDQNILIYAFNLKRNGIINSDLALANEFNRRIYHYLRPENDRPIHDYKLIVTNSILKQKYYGKLLLEGFLKRMGIVIINKEPIEINVIRSVSMNPWITETEEGSFLNIIEKELKDTAKIVIEEFEKEGKFNI